MANNSIKCLQAILQSISNCCDCNHVEGCITLGQGNHELVITTAVSPSNVFLSVTTIGTPVCVADINMVGYSLVPNGFVLYANIKSNAAEVCYILE